MRYDIWIDISNTPQVFFFSSILKELKISYSIFLTARSRAETTELMKILNLDIDCKVFGKDYKNAYLKSLSMCLRSIQLFCSVPSFKIAMSFENPMPVLPAKLRRKKIVLFLDNDLKLFEEKGFVQNLETKVKRYADIVVVPKVSAENFSKVFNKSKIFSYDGYKEHIYIADYIPDNKFLEVVPFRHYVVVRPEALSALYVSEKSSLVPDILHGLEKEGINVVYLPRDPGDENFAKGFKNVYVLPKPLNGLDLAYHARAVLTGSGTMAREAAVLGTPAVSFFPSDKLLSVDRDLVNKGEMMHSRIVDEIISYIEMNWDKKRFFSFEKAKNVKNELCQILYKEVFCTG